MASRQELYDRIRETSRNEVILEEMIRLGFWPRDEAAPHNPATEIRREGELTRQLQELATQNRRLKDIERQKRAARKKRMQESRQKQKENKERRLQEREERSVAWQEKKKTEIVYLGEEVSTSLNQQTSDVSRLSDSGLPNFANIEALANAMGIHVGELRFLSYNRRTAQVSHYRRFGLRKKTGGIRKISAPMPRLKRAQEWILANILELIPLHDAAHGFRRGRSIVTNARPHVGQDVVINMDLEDFFPTVTFPRIRGVFRKMGYSGQLSTVLALICSEPETEEVHLDGRTFFVAKTDRRLPQGAPTSPALTNIICRGLDARLTGLAQRFGFTYTRYADDMTFSGSGPALQNIGRVLRQANYIIEQEDFKVHPKKTRVFRKSSRQEVTGLVVNERLGVNRELLRRFRALLFQIDRDGPANKHWGHSSDVMTSIEGFANFVVMVNPEQGRLFQETVRTLHSEHGRGEKRYEQRVKWVEKPTVVPSVSTKPLVESSPPMSKKKPWWKFW